MAHLESFGTLDKLSELHSMTKTHKTIEEPEEYVDFDALENAAENLMQHLSVDHLDMLHYRFMTGKLDFCFCDYSILVMIPSRADSSTVFSSACICLLSRGSLQ